MACPGSVRLIAALPEPLRDRRSVYAAEGSAAHELGELCLKEGKPARDFLGMAIGVEDWDDAFEVTEEMAEAVQVYVDLVDDLRARHPGAQEWIEFRTKPFADRDDLGGTGDFVLLEAFGDLYVVDYKHGKGVPVEVERNPQLMTYGLGALRGCGGADDVDRVHIVVVQPRAPHPDGPVRTWTITARELVEWGETMRAAADATYEPDAQLVDGGHCRFCPAKATCPKLRGAVQEQVLVAFDQPVPEEVEPRLPDLRDPTQVGRALEYVPLIDEWCRAVEGAALRLAESGARIPGFKLVRKRSNRRWRDAAEVERKLRAKAGVSVDTFMEPRKLMGPAKVEKVVGKKWVERHAEKPEGGLTLAPASDGREAVEVRKVEFPDDAPAIPAKAGGGDWP